MPYFFILRTFQYHSDIEYLFIFPKHEPGVNEQPIIIRTKQISAGLQLSKPSVSITDCSPQILTGCVTCRSRILCPLSWTCRQTESTELSSLLVETIVYKMERKMYWYLLFRKYLGKTSDLKALCSSLIAFVVGLVNRNSCFVSVFKFRKWTSSCIHG
jgi:hypothetical protein